MYRIFSMEKILITGATGFLGRHSSQVFHSLSDYEIIEVSSADYDLMKENQVIRMFEDINPDHVVHLAGYSGGIYSNRMKPAEYYYKNLQLITLTFHYAYEYNVKNILIPIGGCSYPANAKSPIKEEVMWEGFAQIQSAGYAMAKKMALVQGLAYRQQYGFNSVVILPGNMYGPYDNFSSLDSHVIPAMIRKFYEAKLEGLNEVSFWGTGQPQRDFVYVQDVAKLLPYFLLEYDAGSPINISTGEAVSIKELAEMIRQIIKFEGSISWDSGQPDGQMIKIFSVNKLHSLGKSCNTSLRDGLEKTINWFVENWPDGVRIDDSVAVIGNEA
jgi:GDP-L-fucose synthase